MRQQKEVQNMVPPGCIRFFMKGCGNLTEEHLESHFAFYGGLNEVTILYDKKTQRSRGMAFVTLRAQGVWEGKRTTPQMLKDWVMGEKHVVAGVTLELAQAEVKREDDEEAKHE